MIPLELWLYIWSPRIAHSARDVVRCAATCRKLWDLMRSDEKIWRDWTIIERLFVPNIEWLLKQDYSVMDTIRLRPEIGWYLHFVQQYELRQVWLRPSNSRQTSEPSRLVYETLNISVLLAIVGDAKADQWTELNESQLEQLWELTAPRTFEKGEVDLTVRTLRSGVPHSASTCKDSLNPNRIIALIRTQEVSVLLEQSDNLYRVRRLTKMFERDIYLYSCTGNWMYLRCNRGAQWVHMTTEETEVRSMDCDVIMDAFGNVIRLIDGVLTYRGRSIDLGEVEKVIYKPRLLPGHVIAQYRSGRLVFIELNSMLTAMQLYLYLEHNKPLELWFLDDFLFGSDLIERDTFAYLKAFRIIVQGADHWMEALRNHNAALSPPLEASLVKGPKVPWSRWTWNAMATSRDFLSFRHDYISFDWNPLDVYGNPLNVSDLRSSSRSYGTHRLDTKNGFMARNRPQVICSEDARSVWCSCTELVATALLRLRLPK